MILLDTAKLLETFELVEGFPAIVRDWGVLESAIHRQSITVFGQEMYPTLDLKVAALMDSISRSHPLIDGNKRLTYLAARVTYRLNGRPIRRGSADELVAFILEISDEHLEVPDIAARLATIFVADVLAIDSNA